MEIIIKIALIIFCMIIGGVFAIIFFKLKYFVGIWQIDTRNPNAIITRACFNKCAPEDISNKKYVIFLVDSNAKLSSRKEEE